MKGWVYIITSEGYPNLVKVGYSRQDPEYRVQSLSAGHPYRCVSEYEFLVTNPSKIEKESHKLLTPKHEGGEWFRCNIEEAVIAIRKVADNHIINEINNYEKRLVEKSLAQLNNAIKAYEKKDYFLSFEIYNSLVESEYISLNDKIKIQSTLGEMYEYGRGTEKNYQNAINWYMKAGRQDDIQAQVRLGFIYMIGYGVEKDDIKAFDWFKKAAEQGNSHAQNCLGRFYEQGRIVTQSYEEAANWYKKSSIQEHISAQNSLKNAYDLISL